MEFKKYQHIERFGTTEVDGIVTQVLIDIFRLRFKEEIK